MPSGSLRWQNHKGDQQKDQANQTSYVNSFGNMIPGAEVFGSISKVCQSSACRHAYRKGKDNPSMDTVDNSRDPSQFGLQVRRTFRPRLTLSAVSLTLSLGTYSHPCQSLTRHKKVQDTVLEVMKLHSPFCIQPKEIINANPIRM